MIFIGHIYSIENIKNGKRYIGKSFNVDKRLKQHFRIKWDCPMTPLYRDMLEYGKEYFKPTIIHTIIETDSDIAQCHLNEAETHFIKQFHTTDSNKGYNLYLSNGVMIHDEERISEQMKRNSSENKPSHRRKRVRQMTLHGEVVAEFDSITEASIKTGVNIGSISMVVNGKRKTAGTSMPDGSLKRYIFEKVE